MRRRTPLPGDDLLPDAAVTATHAATIRAAPDAVWPWLAQMGWGRAGWYSIDRLDNGGAPSAWTLLEGIPPPAPGHLVPADRRGGAFEVLVADPPRALVLGALIAGGGRRLLPLRTAGTGRSWRMTWAFALRPLPGGGTRLTVRMRVAGPRSLRLHGPWIRAGHGLMQRAQLRNLARRAERHRL